MAPRSTPGAFVGVISDTHGKLRPEALAALQGASLILHGGDIGGPEILTELGRIAPVYAVRGNNDVGPWAYRIPETLVVPWEGGPIFVIHDVKMMDGAAATREASPFAVVVSGHSHKPSVEARGGVVWLNPGSAGPRRFTLPVTVARLTNEGGVPRARIVDLLDQAAAPNGIR